MGQKIGIPGFEMDELDFAAPTERTPHTGARLELDALVDTLGVDEVRVLTRIAMRLCVGSRLYGTLRLPSTPETSAAKRRARSSRTPSFTSPAPGSRPKARPDSPPMESPMKTMNSELTYTNFCHAFPPYFVPSKIEHELEWFYQRGEEDITKGKPWDPERRWSKIAHRIVQGWLSAMDEYDRDVLRVAYAKEPRPFELQRRLGRVTTVVVRLVALEAGWPHDPVEQKAHDMRTATRLAEEHADHGPRTVRRFIGPAVCVLRAAVRAYARERGRGPAMTSRISLLPEFKKTKEDK
jgi:hypothetical protein